MKILIIGGTGLLSTSVAQQLINRGEEVTLINRGRTPSRLTGRFRQLIGDMGNADAFTALVRGEGAWDCVIDMINASPDRALLVATVASGNTRQLIFCSTTSVYRKPPNYYPVREDHPLGASVVNGVNKARCEGIYRALNNAVTVIRPGHIYGETGAIIHSLGKVPGFLDRVRRGKPVIVHGDGTGLWSALHADDVARVFVAATGNPTAFGSVYNATGEASFTWDQYHEKIAEAMDVPVPPLVHVPVESLGRIAGENAAQVQHSLQYPGIYDMTHARQDLNWKQTIPFVEGMRRTIRWLADHKRIEPWDVSSEYERILMEATKGQQ